MKRNRTLQYLTLAASLLAGVASASAATIPVSGILRGVHHWTADNEYLLDGWVYVVDGAVLNIEAGTVIRGKEAASAPNYGALFVCRGGKINALGTRLRPIIFTTESDDLADPFDIPLADEGGGGRGLWGGVVILGRGRINRPDSEASGSGANPDGSFYQLYEGLNDATDPETGQGLHRYGGSNNDDSSGALRFVSIRYSGKALDANKELNALSLAGVGRGTVLEYVEVYAGADDGFEIWGGAVNSRYLVAAYCSDEMFDMDQGHEGKHQFWFGLQGITGDEGVELNGQPSGGSNVNVPGAEPLGRHQIYNATIIGEGGAGSGSDAMNTRSDYHGSIHNSVFMQFQGRDQVSSVPTYNGTVTHNLFWENVGGRGTVVEVDNAFADPLLAMIDRGQNEKLDPRPAANSPVFTGAKEAPKDGFFIAAPYKGAFDVNDNWLLGWTALYQNGHLKEKGAKTITVSGILRGVHHWTADNEYLLDGWVYVVDGAVLNIEAGTVIRGKEAASAPNYGALFVCRGGKINALGTRLRPIIFTTESDDLADPFDIPLADEGGGGRGLWGGVVILGRGRINRPDSEASGSGANPDGSFYQLYEGLNDATDPETGQGLHRYGGSNNDDSSGALRFVSIRYSGKALDANKELNALSLAGVGRGTVLEYVEVYAGADDGFEIWGGAVNSRYLVAAYCSDEMFDMDQGHEGKHQFWFGLQGITGDEGVELNGQPSGGSNVNVPGAEPLGRHQIYNATIIGEGGAGSGSDAMNTRSDYHGSIHNSVFMQFQGRDQVSSVPTYNGTVTHNLFWENVGGRGTVVEVDNAFADPLLAMIDRGQNEKLDPRPAANSPVFTGAKEAPKDGFFIAAPYKGAFKDAQWALDWTALTDNGHLKPVALALVSEQPKPAEPGLTNLWQVVSNNPDLSTLKTAIEVAGLKSALEGTDPLTVFAPNNAAFAALPPGTLEGLLNNPAQLSAVLTYHALAGARTAESLTPGDYPTLQGANVTVTKPEGKFMVNNATVLTADVLASNGVAHVIDMVLLPPAPPQPPLLSATRDGNNLVLTWTGSGASFKVQRKVSLGDANWTDVATTAENTYTVPIEGEAAFYRVVTP